MVLFRHLAIWWLLFVLFCFYFHLDWLFSAYILGHCFSLGLVNYSISFFKHLNLFSWCSTTLSSSQRVPKKYYFNIFLYWKEIHFAITNSLKIGQVLNHFLPLDLKHKSYYLLEDTFLRNQHMLILKRNLIKVWFTCLEIQPSKNSTICGSADICLASFIIQIAITGFRGKARR